MDVGLTERRMRSLTGDVGLRYWERRLELTAIRGLLEMTYVCNNRGVDLEQVKGCSLHGDPELWYRKCKLRSSRKQ